MPWRRDRLPTPVFLGFPGGSNSRESACNVEDLGFVPVWEDALEEGMATHSSILACRIPMDREHGMLQFMGLQSQTQLSDGTELSSPRASLEAQLVKNPPAMQETPVRFLGQKDLLEKG